MPLPNQLLLKCCRRGVSTGLSAAFNRPALKRTGLGLKGQDPLSATFNLHRAAPGLKRTGLFGIDLLQGSDGFHVIRDLAMGHARSLVNEILQQTQASNTDTNVVALFDELSNCLCKVADLAEFIRIGHPQARYRSTAEQTSVAISSLVEQLNTDRRLYDALKAASFDDKLDEYVAKLFMFDFEQSGIHLDKRERQEVLHLNESILKLGSIFAANANQGRLVSLKDIPANVRANFTSVGSSAHGSRMSAAKAAANSDRVLINSLHAESSNELVREAAYRLYLRSDKAQLETLGKLLDCRLRLAQLCGFPSYAHRAVKNSIAGTPEVVREFLDILNDRLRPLAKSDYDQMLQLKRNDQNIVQKRSTATLNAWDVPYYSANYKRGTFNEIVLKCLPYFSIGACMDGLNMIFNRLYGISMRVDPSSSQSGELWHDDVIKLSIIDEDESTLLGHIYCDLFERPHKQHQDCHHTIRGGCYLRDGTYQLPIVVLVLSLPDPSAATNTGEPSPSLLSPSMVDNLFHEMGHAMHSMLARTKYQHITGTRCSTDLAEVPSILMEFFASDPRIVGKFARHHATGAKIPNDLLDCWLKSKKVFIASETQLQVFYAALDQAYHSPLVGTSDLPAMAAAAADTDAGHTSDWTTQALARIQHQYYPSIPYVGGTAWQLRFSHLVGYGAKYYSYLVSRAVATAIWSKLFADDPLSRRAGDKYRREVLAHGGGKPAQQIAEDTLGCRVDASFIARSVVASFRQPPALAAA